MSNWYNRQFGDRQTFALAFSLARVPHPRGDAAVDASWGGVSLWARGRCLTRSVSEESGVVDEVRWNLLSVLQWLRDSAVRLVNEEPFPQPSLQERVPDACAWFNSTESPPWTLSASEESEWFLARSEWRQHHALRRAAADAALPNVMFRRLGDFLEVSWDNDGWGSTRPRLSFVEKRGAELVCAAKAADVLLDSLRDVSRELANHAREPALQALEQAAAVLSADEQDWKWLVPRQTAAVIEQDAGLASRLRQHTVAFKRGVYVPHEPTTLLLRQAVVTSSDELATILQLASTPLGKPVSEPVGRLIEPTPAHGMEPWHAGYDRALKVREELGWGNDPAPDLDEWLSANNVAVRRVLLPSSVQSLTKRTADGRALAGLNTAAKTLSREMGLAEAFGHILMDVDSQAIHGAREHWPTAARARAFGAMLLLPEEGVRNLLSGLSSLSVPDVQRVMKHFGTGPYVTTYHMRNHGLITNEKRQELLQQLAA